MTTTQFNKDISSEKIFVEVAYLAGTGHTYYARGVIESIITDDCGRVQYVALHTKEARLLLIPHERVLTITELEFPDGG